MKLFGHRLAGFSKALVILVTVLLVASGLCGVTTALEDRIGGWYAMPNTSWANFLAISGFVELVAILISLVGLLIVAIAWPATALSNRAVKLQKDKTQHLFERDDDSTHDGPR